MKKIGFAFVVFALAACGSPPSATTANGKSATPIGAKTEREPPGPIHHVVLVTIDGMVPDVYLHPDAHGLEVPTFRKIVAEAAWSEGAEPVFPSVTYPDHTSMLTGVVPAKHGIVANRSFDPFENDLDGWRWYAEDIRRDPIWRLADRAGYTTALVHWPVSVGAKVTWLVPEVWRAKNDNDRKLVRALSTPGLFEEVIAKHPDFWARFAPPDVHDTALGDIATTLLANHRPTLTCVHLVEVDGEQHRHGMWSPEAVAAIENADAQVARILETLRSSGLAADTDVIVASDHGFMDADKMVVPGALLREAGLVTLNAAGKVTDWKAAVTASSGEAYVYVRDPNDAATEAKVRAIFDQKMHEPRSAIGHVYDAAEIRSLGGDPAAFLALEAAPGNQFGGGVSGDYTSSATYHATHGYDPRRPEMQASLLATGPGIAHAKITGARLVDIAPTIASWLGLTLGDVDGKVLPLRAAAK